jgi:hypothetical protein
MTSGPVSLLPPANCRARPREPALRPEPVPAVADALAAEFPGSEHVVIAGLAAAAYRAVWTYAAVHGLAIVS